MGSEKVTHLWNEVKKGFMTSYNFLEINSYQLIAIEGESVLIILDLTLALTRVPEMSRWLSDNAKAPKQ
jgi:prophage maintenance system killer protein